MGREIRRVPADWEHPKYTEDNATRRENIGNDRAIYDEDYETASENWMAELAQWQRGEHPEQPCKYCKYFWEYGGPPDEMAHRDRKWTAEEATHFQIYETVSEGTPVTPHFATKEELVDYLVEHGDYWDQHRGDGGWLRTNAEAFVESEYAPTMMTTRTESSVEIQMPRDMGAP